MAMSIPRAGELNRRVTLREKKDIPDDDSGLTTSYTGSPAWAKIEPVGTAVYAAGVQTDNRITHRVTLRYRPGITDAWEVVATVAGVEVVYRVRRVTDLNGLRRFTVLEVEEL